VDRRDVLALALQAAHAIGPAEMRQGFAAMIVCAVFLNYVPQIHRSGSHRFTMSKVKFKKHPAKMTSGELAEGVFHPKVLKAVREHLEKDNSAKKPVKSSK